MRLICRHRIFKGLGFFSGGREDYDKLTMVENYIKILLKRKEDLLALTGSKTVPFQKHHYSAAKMTKK